MLNSLLQDSVYIDDACTVRDPIHNTKLMKLQGHLRNPHEFKETHLSVTLPMGMFTCINMHRTC